MNETDVKDSRGNVVISKGLKVRHKDSPFEYTVDSVLQEPDGEVTIMLASPEAPRFEPAEEEIMIVDKNVPDVLYWGRVGIEEENTTSKTTNQNITSQPHNHTKRRRQPACAPATRAGGMRGAIE